MQTLTLKPDGSPWVIPTPFGFILIHRVPKEPRKVQVKLPVGLKAFKGEERALENSPYVKKENGKLVPIFPMLVPKVNKEGELEGLEIPTTFVLGET